MRITKVFDTFKYLSPKQEHGLKTLYVALFALSIHWALIGHINSSFLEQFFTTGETSMLFLLGSIGSLALMLRLSRFLRTIGNFKLTIFLSLLEIGALFGMAHAETSVIALTAFMVHYLVVPILLFNLDIFIETVIGKEEKRTGSTRGLYLVFLSFAGAIAPLLSGFIIGNTATPDFTNVYVASALSMLPFMAIITFYFSSFKDPEYSHKGVVTQIRTFMSTNLLRNVFVVHLLLQLFFAWMTIYTPLYLATYAGFNWTEIGLILFVALLAYVIFEYPIGVIADLYIGEKEMMAAGFVLIAVATSWLAFLPPATILPWMVAMFLTRVGASLVEATSESYFFKHIQGNDSDKLSVYRTARPLSFIIIPALWAYGLIHVDASFTFIILGLLMVPGIFFTLLLRDTR